MFTWYLTAIRGHEVLEQFTPKWKLLSFFTPTFHLTLLTKHKNSVIRMLVSFLSNMECWVLTWAVKFKNDDRRGYFSYTIYAFLWSQKYLLHLLQFLSWTLACSWESYKKVKRVHYNSKLNFPGWVNLFYTKHNMLFKDIWEYKRVK